MNCRGASRGLPVWWLLMAAGASWFLSTLAGSPYQDLAELGFATGAWHYLFLAWLLLAFPTGLIRKRTSLASRGTRILTRSVRAVSTL